MTYMNKLLIILLSALVISCQQINGLEAPATVSSVIRGVPDIKVDNEYFNSAKYSFIKVKSGRFINFTATLVSIDNKIYKWVSSEGHKIYTKDGKIIKINAQPENSFYHLPSSFSLLENSTVEFNVFFENPQALMTQNSQIENFYDEQIIYLEEKIDVIRYDEKVTTQIFEWESVNKYWIDRGSDLVIRSEQNLYPFRKTYLIEFYYKFN